MFAGNTDLVLPEPVPVTYTHQASLSGTLPQHSNRQLSATASSRALTKLRFPALFLLTQTVNSVTTSSLTHLLPISLTFSLCTPLPGSCVLLQTNGHFVSPMLEQNPLANTVSPTCSCFSSVLLAMEFAPY